MTIISQYLAILTACLLIKTTSSSNPFNGATRVAGAELSGISSHERRRELAVQFSDNFYNTDLFEHYYRVPTPTYESYRGLDDTALFSSSVSINEHFAIVGSNGFNVFEGIVHVYIPTNLCAWSLQSLITTPSGANDNFGSSVAIDGLVLVTGANARAAYTGIAYVYQYVNGNFWQRMATLQSPMGLYHGFGCQVDISGDFLIVATALNNAFIYENREQGWSLTASLVPPEENIFFGRSVAISGDLAFVGADQFNGTDGAVYIYQLNASDPEHPWPLLQMLPSVQGENTYFGHSLAYYNGTLVVGAVGHRKGAYRIGGHQSVNNTGAIHIFDLAEDGSSFSLSQSITSPAGENSYFGASVGIEDIEIIVGANGYPAGNGTGAAFVYRRNFTEERFPNQKANWELVVSLSSLQGEMGNFGYTTDITKHYAAVGSYGHDDLRGGISLVCRDIYAPPPEPPVPAITGPPTAAPTVPTEQQNFGNNKNKKKKNKWPIGVVVAMMLGGVMVALAAALIIYCCCCCCIPPAAILKKKKKKKDGEEDSPYTVHGAGGEINEDGTSIYQYSEDFLSSYGDGSDVSSEFSEEVSGDIFEKKDKKKGKKDTKPSPYTVHSYAGYQQDADEEAWLSGKVDDKVAQQKELDDTSTSYETPMPIYTAFTSPRVVNKTVSIQQHQQQMASGSFSSPTRTAQLPAEDLAGMDDSHHSEDLNLPVRSAVTLLSATAASEQDARREATSVQFSKPKTVSHQQTIVEFSHTELTSVTELCENNAQLISSVTAAAESRARTSFAEYKTKMAALEARRLDQARQLLQQSEQHHEQAMLLTAVEAEVQTSKEDEERETREAMIASARAKAAQLAATRLAGFKAQQLEIARLKAEEQQEMERHLASAATLEEASRLEDERLQTAIERARTEAEQERLAAETAQLSLPKVAAESMETVDRASAKEQARLKAEERARERFAMFKARAEAEAAVRASTSSDKENAAVALAKASLGAADLQLHATQEFIGKHAAQAAQASIGEQSVNSVVNFSSQSVVTSQKSSTYTAVHSSSSDVRETVTADEPNILSIADDSPV